MRRARACGQRDRTSHASSFVQRSTGCDAEVKATRDALCPSALRRMYAMPARACLEMLAQPRCARVPSKAAGYDSGSTVGCNPPLTCVRALRVCRKGRRSCSMCLCACAMRCWLLLNMRLPCAVMWCHTDDVCTIYCV